MTGWGGMSVTRLLLGWRLRGLREKAGVRVEDAARKAGISQATVWRIEKGDVRCRCRSRDIIRLSRQYGARPGLANDLGRVASEVKALSPARGLLADEMEVSLGLECSADRICCYGAEYVPDLFQTGRYAEVLGGGRDGRAQRIRYEILTGRYSSARIELVVAQRGLERIVGDSEIMAEQLGAVRAAAEMPHVDVRIAAAPSGIGSFTIFEFPEHPWLGETPTVVRLDRPDGYDLLHDAADIEYYREAWSRLVEEAEGWKAVLGF